MAPKLIDYSWYSYFDGGAGKRVSDWGQAEQCNRCRRAIVHVYTVVHDDNARERVGRECVAAAMGWKYKNPDVLKKVEQKALTYQYARERTIEWVQAQIAKLSATTPEAAVEAVFAEYPKWRKEAGRPAIFSDGTRFIAQFMSVDSNVENVEKLTVRGALESLGWREVSPPTGGKRRHARASLASLNRSVRGLLR